MGPLMFVVGGRTNNVGEKLPLEVYDTESSEWFKFNALQRFRHVSWSSHLDSKTKLFVHGGFEHSTPNVPLNSVGIVELEKLFARSEGLMQKVKSVVEKMSRESKTGGKENMTQSYKKNAPLA